MSDVEPWVPVDLAPDWVYEWTTGLFPDGSETDSGDAGDALGLAAGQVGDVHGASLSGALRVNASVASMSQEQFNEFIAPYFLGSDPILEALARQLLELSRLAYGYKKDLTYAKLQVNIQTLFLVLEWAITIALAVWTNGTSLGWFLTRAFGRRLFLKELLDEIAEELGMNLITEATVQAIMASNGYGVDWGQLGLSAFSGGVGGALGHGLGEMVGHAAARSALGSWQRRLMKGFETLPGEIARQALVNTGAGAVTWGASPLFGQPAGDFWETVMGGMRGSLFSGAAFYVPGHVQRRRTFLHLATPHESFTATLGKDGRTLRLFNEDGLPVGRGTLRVDPQAGQLSLSHNGATHLLVDASYDPSSGVGEVRGVHRDNALTFQVSPSNSTPGGPLEVRLHEEVRQIESPTLVRTADGGQWQAPTGTMVAYNSNQQSVYALQPVMGHSAAGVPEFHAGLVDANGRGIAVIQPGPAAAGGQAANGQAAGVLVTDLDPNWTVMSDNGRVVVLQPTTGAGPAGVTQFTITQDESGVRVSHSTAASPAAPAVRNLLVSPPPAAPVTATAPTLTAPTLTAPTAATPAAAAPTVATTPAARTTGQTTSVTPPAATPGKVSAQPTGKPGGETAQRKLRLVPQPVQAEPLSSAPSTETQKPTTVTLQKINATIAKLQEQPPGAKVDSLRADLEALRGEIIGKQDTDRETQKLIEETIARADQLMGEELVSAKVDSRPKLPGQVGYLAPDISSQTSAGHQFLTSGYEQFAARGFDIRSQAEPPDRQNRAPEGTPPQGISPEGIPPQVEQVATGPTDQTAPEQTPTMGGDKTPPARPSRAKLFAWDGTNNSLPHKPGLIWASKDGSRQLLFESRKQTADEVIFRKRSLHLPKDPKLVLRQHETLVRYEAPEPPGGRRWTAQWEFPTQREAENAKRVFEELGVADRITAVAVEFDEDAAARRYDEWQRRRSGEAFQDGVHFDLAESSAHRDTVAPAVPLTPGALTSDQLAFAAAHGLDPARFADLMGGHIKLEPGDGFTEETVIATVAQAYGDPGLRLLKAGASFREIGMLVDAAQRSGVALDRLAQAMEGDVKLDVLVRDRAQTLLEEKAEAIAEVVLEHGRLGLDLLRVGASRGDIVALRQEMAPEDMRRIVGLVDDADAPLPYKLAYESVAAENAIGPALRKMSARGLSPAFRNEFAGRGVVEPVRVLMERDLLVSKENLVYFMIKVHSELGQGSPNVGLLAQLHEAALRVGEDHRVELESYADLVDLDDGAHGTAIQLKAINSGPEPADKVGLALNRFTIEAMDQLKGLHGEKPPPGMALVAEVHVLNERNQVFSMGRDEVLANLRDWFAGGDKYRYRDQFVVEDRDTAGELIGTRDINIVVKNDTGTHVFTPDDFPSRPASAPPPSEPPAPPPPSEPPASPPPSEPAEQAPPSAQAPLGSHPAVTAALVLARHHQADLPPDEFQRQLAGLVGGLSSEHLAEFYRLAPPGAARAEVPRLIADAMLEESLPYVARAQTRPDGSIRVTGLLRDWAVPVEVVNEIRESLRVRIADEASVDQIRVDQIRAEVVAALGAHVSAVADPGRPPSRGALLALARLADAPISADAQDAVHAVTRDLLGEHPYLAAQDSPSPEVRRLLDALEGSFTGPAEEPPPAPHAPSPAVGAGPGVPGGAGTHLHHGPRSRHYDPRGVPLGPKQEPKRTFFSELEPSSNPIGEALDTGTADPLPRRYGEHRAVLESGVPELTEALRGGESVDRQAVDLRALEIRARVAEIADDMGERAREIEERVVHWKGLAAKEKAKADPAVQGEDLQTLPELRVHILETAAQTARDARERFRFLAELLREAELGGHDPAELAAWLDHSWANALAGHIACEQALDRMAPAREGLSFSIPFGDIPVTQDLVDEFRALGVDISEVELQRRLHENWSGIVLPGGSVLTIGGYEFRVQALPFDLYEEHDLNERWETDQLQVAKIPLGGHKAGVTKGGDISASWKLPIIKIIQGVLASFPSLAWIAEMMNVFTLDVGGTGTYATSNARTLSTEHQRGDLSDSKSVIFRSQLVLTVDKRPRDWYADPPRSRDGWERVFHGPVPGSLDLHVPQPCIAQPPPAHTRVIPPDVQSAQFPAGPRIPRIMANVENLDHLFVELVGLLPDPLKNEFFVSQIRNALNVVDVRLRDALGARGYRVRLMHEGNIVGELTVRAKISGNDARVVGFSKWEHEQLEAGIGGYTESTTTNNVGKVGLNAGVSVPNSQAAAHAFTVDPKVNNSESHNIGIEATAGSLELIIQVDKGLEQVTVYARVEVTAELELFDVTYGKRTISAIDRVGALLLGPHKEMYEYGLPVSGDPPELLPVGLADKWPGWLVEGVGILATVREMLDGWDKVHDDLYNHLAERGLLPRRDGSGGYHYSDDPGKLEAELNNLSVMELFKHENLKSSLGRLDQTGILIGFWEWQRGGTRREVFFKIRFELDTQNASCLGENPNNIILNLPVGVRSFGHSATRGKTSTWGGGASGEIGGASGEPGIGSGNLTGGRDTSGQVKGSYSQDIVDTSLYLAVNARAFEMPGKITVTELGKGEVTSAPGKTILELSGGLFKPENQAKPGQHIIRSTPGNGKISRLLPQGSTPLCVEMRGLLEAITRVAGIDPRDGSAVADVLRISPTVLMTGMSRMTEAPCRINIGKSGGVELRAEAVTVEYIARDDNVSVHLNRINAYALSHGIDVTENVALNGGFEPGFPHNVFGGGNVSVPLSRSGSTGQTWSESQSKRYEMIRGNVGAKFYMYKVEYRVAATGSGRSSSSEQVSVIVGYGVTEREAMDFYAAGKLPIAPEHVADALRRWSADDQDPDRLDLDRNLVARVLDRFVTEQSGTAPEDIAAWAERLVKEYPDVDPTKYPDPKSSPLGAIHKLATGNYPAAADYRQMQGHVWDRPGNWGVQRIVGSDGESVELYKEVRKGIEKVLPPGKSRQEAEEVLAGQLVDNVWHQGIFREMLRPEGWHCDIPGSGGKYVHVEIRAKFDGSQTYVGFDRTGSFETLMYDVRGGAHGTSGAETRGAGLSGGAKPDGYSVAGNFGRAHSHTGGVTLGHGATGITGVAFYKRLGLGYFDGRVCFEIIVREIQGSLLGQKAGMPVMFDRVFHPGKPSVAYGHVNATVRRFVPLEYVHNPGKPLEPPLPRAGKVGFVPHYPFVESVHVAGMRGTLAQKLQELGWRLDDLGPEYQIPLQRKLSSDFLAADLMVTLRAPQPLLTFPDPGKPGDMVTLKLEAELYDPQKIQGGIERPRHTDTKRAETFSDSSVGGSRSNSAGAGLSQLVPYLPDFAGGRSRSYSYGGKTGETTNTLPKVNVNRATQFQGEVVYHLIVEVRDSSGTVVDTFPPSEIVTGRCFMQVETGDFDKILDSTDYGQVKFPAYENAFTVVAPAKWEDYGELDLNLSMVRGQLESLEGDARVVRLVPNETGAGDLRGVAAALAFELRVNVLVEDGTRRYWVIFDRESGSIREYPLDQPDPRESNPISKALNTFVVGNPGPPADQHAEPESDGSQHPQGPSASHPTAEPHGGPDSFTGGALAGPDPGH
jgi:hypothetical protein